MRESFHLILLSQQLLVPTEYYHSTVKCQNNNEDDTVDILCSIGLEIIELEQSTHTGIDTGESIAYRSCQLGNMPCSIGRIKDRFNSNGLSKNKEESNETIKIFIVC